MSAFSLRYLTARSLTAAALLSLAACGAKSESLIPLVRNEPYEVRADFSDVTETGTESTIRIRVLRDGKFADLQKEFRVVHVAISHVSYGDMLHEVSPLSIGTGEYEVKHAFTQPGHYRIWIELENMAAVKQHGQYADLIATGAFAVEGDALASSLVTEKTFTSTTGEFTLSLESNELRTGTGDTIRITVTDPSGKPYPLPPPEGTRYVLVGQNLSFFSHGHIYTDPDGVTASLPVTFPGPGLYGLWVEADPITDTGYGSIGAPFLLTVR